MKTLQHSDYTCNGFAPIFTFDDVMSPSRSLFHLRFVFWWFRPSHHATRKLDDSPQHRNISCNVKQFNVQLELLMFWKAILCNATPFVCTLYHSTLRSAISRNATLLGMYAVLFYITLSHFTQRYTVCANAVLFDITLSLFTQRHTICVYSALFDITLSYLTQRYTVCVLCCK